MLHKLLQQQLAQMQRRSQQMVANDSQTYVRDLVDAVKTRDNDEIKNALAVIPTDEILGVVGDAGDILSHVEIQVLASIVDEVMELMSDCQNSIEPTTLESIALVDDLVHIRWSGATKSRCYSRAALIQQIASSADIRYYHRVSDDARSSEGFGYIPGDERVVRVGETAWVHFESLRVLLDPGATTTTHFRSRIIAYKQRIGNAENRRGISDLHGQAPGETIHWLEPPLLAESTATPSPSPPRTRREGLRRRASSGRRLRF